MTNFTNSLLCLTLIAAMSSTASAQLVTTKGGSRAQSFGPSSTHLQLYAGGDIRREDMRYRATPTSTPSGPARMRYDGDGFIFAHTWVYGFKFTPFVARADIHLVEGRGANSASYYVANTPVGSSVRGHIKLKAGGYTFLDRTRHADGYIAGSQHTHNIIDAGCTFYPGGCPVRVGIRGSATMGLSADADLVLSPTSSWRMSGTSRVGLVATGTGYVSAAAYAAVGWSGFCAGAECELRFLDSDLSMGVYGNHAGVSGQVGLHVEPLRIFLNVFAEAWRRWTINVWNWSPGYSFLWRKTFS